MQRNELVLKLNDRHVDVDKQFCAHVSTFFVPVVSEMVNPMPPYVSVYLKKCSRAFDE